MGRGECGHEIYVVPDAESSVVLGGHVAVWWASSASLLEGTYLVQLQLVPWILDYFHNPSSLMGLLDP